MVGLSLAALGGCGGERDSDGSTAVGADLVAEFRSEAMNRAHVVDMGIAALEAQGAPTDSASALRFQNTISELLEARYVLQQGLGSLDSLTSAQFATISDSLALQLEELELRVDRAPFELAPDVVGVRDITLARLSVFRSEIAELEVDADSTQGAALALLLERGDALADSLERTTDEDVDLLRTWVVANLRSLRTSLDSLRTEWLGERAHPDSTDVN